MAETENPAVEKQFSAEEVAARLEAERALWEAEAERTRGAVHDAAFTEGKAAAAADLQAELDALKVALQAARDTAAQRESEVLCMKQLRERGLDESLSPLLLSPGETEVAEEEIARRVETIAAAVEQAALRILQSRAAASRPAVGDASPVTPALLRTLPLAKLSAMLN